MLVDRKIITVLLIMPLCMLGGAATVEVAAGGFLKMNCSLDKPYSWDLLQAGPAMMAVVEFTPDNSYACTGQFAAPAGSIVCRSGVSVNTVTGKDVTISNVDVSDGGTYSCRNSGGSGEATDLVVVQNDGPTLLYSMSSSDPNMQPQPQQNQNVEVTQGNVLNFNCTIRFGGLRSPAMELVRRDYTGAEQSLGTSAGNTAQYSLSQSVSVTAQYTVTASDRTFTVTCRLPSFRNITTMMETMTFSPTYGPIANTNMKTIVVMSGGYAVLNCNVSSYPTATYTWFQGTTTPMTGSSDTNRVTSTGDYRCMAKNPRTNNQVTMDFGVQATSSVPSSLHTCIHILFFAIAIQLLL